MYLTCFDKHLNYFELKQEKNGSHWFTMFWTVQKLF